MNMKKAKRLYKLAANQCHIYAHVAMANIEAASKNGADMPKVFTAYPQGPSCCGGRRYSKERELPFPQCDHLYSLLRCRNDGCSIAYSTDLSMPSTKLKSCARCRNATYCSVECQVKDWRLGHDTRASAPRGP